MEVEGDSADGVMPWLDQIVDGECLELMAKLPDHSIDLILADLPYGTSRNRWDSVIDLPSLWREYERLIKPAGAIVLTAAQPFTSVLVASNLKLFKYEWIWSKTVGSGQLNVARQPLRTHESVLVFYRKQPTYHAQMTEGAAYTAKRSTASWADRGYNAQRDHETVNEGVRFPKSVLLVPNPRIKGGHPTQKPVPLMEYMIRTYTNPGDLVLDNVIGSGTTAVAAVNTGRHFIGMEMDPEYAQVARLRVAEAREDLDPNPGHLR
jgi:site-specific DNA-methyltransferase (adenine-specific)